jgi:hypothetical protein
MTQNFSELKIVFSNCLLGGSAWTEIKDSFLGVVRRYLYEVSGLEFEGFNVNGVSGDHMSFSIVILGTFFNLRQDISKTDMLNIEEMMLQITSGIENFSCSEVRVNHTRHRSFESDQKQLKRIT